MQMTKISIARKLHEYKARLHLISCCFTQTIRVFLSPTASLTQCLNEMNPGKLAWSIPLVFLTHQISKRRFLS
ncbi:hypothetical protein EUGRSUZ_I00324 [Eucalyptus grandis]|uniref:Uncharacterized protein n=2 Tax=Eucalyptus grandis TaxID=71139 RepID=A0ACC3JCP3_EUCGR|nr:hypothetical protein EUGRSUZ_I00324 [Eucalyptus grandis]